MNRACEVEVIAIEESDFLPLSRGDLEHKSRDECHWRQVVSNTSYSQFAIPPIYRDSINRLQLPIFEVSSKVLSRSGLLGIEYESIRDKTDVILCNCLGMDRAFKNFQRIYGKYIIGEAAQLLESQSRLRILEQTSNVLGEKLGSSSHDKVGEMASTIPARVAAQFGLKGRAYVVESKDESAIRALIQAIDALNLGKSRAVLIISAQSLDSLSSVDYVERSIEKSSSATGNDFSQIAVEGVSVCLISRAGTFAHPNNRAFPRISAIKCLAEQDVEHYADSQANEIKLLAEFRSADLSKLSDAFSRRKASLKKLRPELYRGYSFANAPMSSFKALIDELALQEEACQAIVCGKSASNNEWVIEINGAPKAYVGYSAELPVMVLASSAIFGDAIGIDAYWEKLSDERGAIIEIGDHFSAHLFEEKRVGPKDSFYNCTASYAPTRSSAYADDLRFTAEQCLTALPLKHSIKSGDRVLAITATSLTGFKERLNAFIEFSPRLKMLADEILEKSELTDSEVLLVQSNINDLINDLAEGSITLGSDLSDLVFSLSGCKGESIAVEAACAGSLAAVDIALNALQNGRVDCAIVLGIEHPVNVSDMTLCSSQRMLAPEIIATFTEFATGFTPGNGAGAIVLKRYEGQLPKPEMLIKSVGASTWSKSVIAPNVDGQVNAMRDALNGFETLIPNVSFIETHGTGTIVGDIVEVDSINRVYGCEARKTPLYLGALKSRFGHTFAAAGIASLIKTHLIAKNGKIPANLIRGPKKESLSLAQKNLDVLEKEKQLSIGESYFTAINAFGTGGINYHVLAEITVH